MNVPKLRFKEFNDEWQNIDLKNVFEYFSTNSLSRDQLSDSGIIKNIHYGDIHRKYSSIVDVGNDVETYIKDINYNNKYEYCKDSDLIFADASEDYEGIGKVIELNNIKCNTVSGLHTILARDKQNLFAPMFKGYYFNSPSIHNQIRILANGFKVYGISKDSINKLNINIPTKEEQSKIARSLYLLDKKIELQTKKIEDLKLFKKGLAKKIFTNMNFVKYKLSDLNITISDGNYGELYPKADELKDYGEVPFLRVNNLRRLRITDNNMKYISKEKHSTLLSGHLKEKDILITTRGEIGLLAIVDSNHIDSNINAQIALLRINDYNQVIPEYLLQYLNFNDKYIKSLQTGSALKQLPLKNLFSMIIQLPDITTQIRISKILSLIDILIEHQYIKQENLIELKKGLMQNMFV